MKKKYAQKKKVLHVYVFFMTPHNLEWGYFEESNASCFWFRYILIDETNLMLFFSLDILFIRTDEFANTEVKNTSRTWAFF